MVRALVQLSVFSLEVVQSVLKQNHLKFDRNGILHLNNTWIQMQGTWSKVEYLLFVLNTKTRLARDFKTGCAQGCPLTATYLLLQACESENRLWYCNTATLTHRQSLTCLRF